VHASARIAPEFGLGSAQYVVQALLSRSSLAAAIAASDRLARKAPVAIDSAEATPADAPAVRAKLRGALGRYLYVSSTRR
jgi:hypothetical protein